MIARRRYRRLPGNRTLEGFGQRDQGVFVADPASDPSHLSRAENFIHNCPDFLPNECAVITAGQLKGSTATPRGTNLVKLYWK